MSSLRAIGTDRYDFDAGRAGSLLTIDLDAVVANWRVLRRLAGRAECAAVVKADAYGLGLDPVAATLRAGGCQTFFVAHVFEGQRLRLLVPDATIYVLNGFLPGAAPLFLEARLRPVLGSLPEIEDWLDAAARAPCALQIDSGMNRLGLAANQLGAAVKLTARLDLALVLSHFAWSGRAGHRRQAARQIELFDAARAHWPGVPASMANSSGLFLEQAHYDLVRPGYAIYGGNPTPDAGNPMRPVVFFEAKVIQVREVAAGDSVGYDGRWVAPSRRRLATISVGYADGLPCSALGTDAGPCGYASANGVLCPIVGRISMDLIVIDVTEVASVTRGDSVELLGASITIDELAARARTIGYEILTRLGQRSHRRAIGGVSAHPTRSASAGSAAAVACELTLGGHAVRDLVQHGDEAGLG